jgi:hypothetical protein
MLDMTGASGNLTAYPQATLTTPLVYHYIFSPFRIPEMTNEIRS